MDHLFKYKFGGSSNKAFMRWGNLLDIFKMKFKTTFKVFSSNSCRYIQLREFSRNVMPTYVEIKELVKFKGNNKKLDPAVFVPTLEEIAGVISLLNQLHSFSSTKLVNYHCWAFVKLSQISRFFLLIKKNIEIGNRFWVFSRYKGRN